MEKVKCTGCKVRKDPDELSMNGFCLVCSDVEEEELEDLEEFDDDQDYFAGTEFDY